MKMFKFLVTVAESSWFNSYWAVNAKVVSFLVACTAHIIKSIHLFHKSDCISCFQPYFTVIITLSIRMHLHKAADILNH